MSEEIWIGGVGAMLLAEGLPLREALDVTDPGGWTAFDLGVRGHVPPALLPARPGRGRLRRVKQLTESELALALCHPDGRIREAALDRAGDHPDLLPLVVIRSADWAEPVRERARRLLEERLDAARAVTLAALVLRLGRRKHGGYAVRLLGELLRHAPGGLLEPLYADADRAVRRFARRLAVAEGLLSPAELARVAARDDDIVVQRLCADAALAAVVRGGAYDDVLPELLGARNTQARAAGVTALRAAGRPEAAVVFLADRSALVRACARYVVRQGEDDPLAWYRERCARPQDVPAGAVIGLAECGQRTDAALLWPLLGHPEARVRARAVAGLRMLDVADAARLRPLLDDPAPGVVRETVLALLPSAAALSEAWLTQRLEAGRPRHQRVAAFRLLGARGGLGRLRAAVALVDDTDLKLRLRARQSVRGWRPEADVRFGDPAVGELLDRARHLFGDAYCFEHLRRAAGLPY
ncbi:hypothetical protein RKD23_005421 [Streptomyces sp. SAI-170]|uniref:hypothetical protein n=1 Tax=Streptomyces sp. SAI-170 TaxID=3377729 RepID=UPI003C7973AF